MCTDFIAFTSCVLDDYFFLFSCSSPARSRRAECMLSIVSQNINIVILQIWKLIAASMGMRSGTESDKSIEGIARTQLNWIIDGEIALRIVSNCNRFDAITIFKCVIQTDARSSPWHVMSNAIDKEESGLKMISHWNWHIANLNCAQCLPQTANLLKRV